VDHTTTSLSNFLAPKYWPTWLGLGVLRLFSFLPLPVLALFGQTIGLIFYYLVSSRRKIAFRNISSCFPELNDTQVRRINRQHFCLVGQSIFSSTMNYWISEKRFVSLVDVKGREHYDQAVESGKNIILLAPHFMVPVCKKSIGRHGSEKRSSSLWWYSG